MTDDAWTPLEKLAQEATAGPWTFDAGTLRRKSKVVKGDRGAFIPGPLNRYRDARYIVALVNAAPDLIAAARRGADTVRCEQPGCPNHLTCTICESPIRYHADDPVSHVGCQIADMAGPVDGTHRNSLEEAVAAVAELAKWYPDQSLGQHKAAVIREALAVLAGQDETEGAAG